jgi:hypothetical protein
MSTGQQHDIVREDRAVTDSNLTAGYVEHRVRKSNTLAYMDTGLVAHDDVSVEGITENRGKDLSGERPHPGPFHEEILLNVRSTESLDA